MKKTIVSVFIVVFLASFIGFIYFEASAKVKCTPTQSDCSLQGCSHAECVNNPIVSCICTHCSDDPGGYCFEDPDCKSGICIGGNRSTCTIGTCGSAPSIPSIKL